MRTRVPREADEPAGGYSVFSTSLAWTMTSNPDSERRPIKVAPFGDTRRIAARNKWCGCPVLSRKRQDPTNEFSGSSDERIRSKERFGTQNNAQNDGRSCCSAAAALAVCVAMSPTLAKSLPLKSEWASQPHDLSNVWARNAASVEEL
jgi:hypothetical protein